VAIHTHFELPGFAGILVGAQIFRIPQGVGNRSDAGPCHHLRDQAHALAMIVAREGGGDDLFESLLALLSHVPGQMAGSRIVIIFAARRVGCLIINLCQLDRRRVDPGLERLLVPPGRDDEPLTPFVSRPQELKAFEAVLIVDGVGAGGEAPGEPLEPCLAIDRA